MNNNETKCQNGTIISTLGQKVRRLFSFPLAPIFNVNECEKKIKSAQASFFARITDISTMNKGEKGDPKKSSQPFVQDCGQITSVMQNNVLKIKGAAIEKQK